MEVIVLNVDGMTCGHCKMAVENAVKDIPGVNGVTVNLETKKVTVTTKRGEVSKDVLKAAIEEEGYTVL